MRVLNFLSKFSVLLFALLASCARPTVFVESFDQLFHPSSPTLTTVNPDSPSNEDKPIVGGTSDPLNDVYLYSQENCQGLVLGSSKSSAAGEFNIQSISLTDGTYSFSSKAINSEGLETCSSNSLSYTIDTTVPSTEVGTPSSPSTNQDSVVEYVIENSENSTISTDISDYTINTTGTANCTAEIITNNDTTSIFRFSNCTGDGNVFFIIPAESISDEAGNLNESAITSSQFIVDNSSPTLNSLYPPNGDFSVMPSTLIIQLNENIKASSVTIDDFLFGGNCDLGTGNALSIVNNQITLTFAPDNSCDLLENVTVDLNLADIEDENGNPGTGSVSANFRNNNVGPTSVSFNPDDGSLSGMPDNIDLEFVQNIDASSVILSDFSLSGTCSTASISGLSVSSNTINLTLSGEELCADTETLVLSVDLSDINDSFGNPGSGTETLNLVNDLSGPVLSITEDTGDFNPLPSLINLTYDSDTDTDSLTTDDFSLSSTCNGISLGVLNKLSTSASLALVGTGACSHGDTINLSIDSSLVKDDLNNAGSGVISKVYTLDSEGPQVLSKTSSGTLNSLPSSVSYTLSTDLDATSIGVEDLAITGTCSGVSLGSLSTSSNIVTANLLGTGSCSNAEDMIISLDLSGIKDLVGNFGSGTSTVDIELDTLGPSGTWNNVGGSITSLPSSVSVEFPADTDMSSISLADFALGGDCSGPGISLGITGNVALLSLSNLSVCLHAEVFSITLDQSAIQDLAGNSGTGSSAVSWTFDKLGPSASFLTAGGNINPLASVIDIQLDADTDMSSIDLSDLSLTGDCSLASLDSISVDGTKLTVNIADVNLCTSLLGIDLSLDLTGVLDLLGNPGTGNISRSFIFDDVAPTFTSNLSGGSLSILPTQLILDLSSDTDMSTFDNSMLSLSGTCGSASLGTIVVSGTQVTVNLLDTGLCSLASVLTLDIDLNGLQDNTGNTGAVSASISFIKVL